MRCIAIANREDTETVGANAGAAAYAAARVVWGLVRVRITFLGEIAARAAAAVATKSKSGTDAEAAAATAAAAKAFVLAKGGAQAGEVQETLVGRWVLASGHERAVRPCSKMMARPLTKLACCFNNNIAIVTTRHDIVYAYTWTCSYD